MARIRTIKPEFFTSEDIVSLSPLARLLYIAIWCEADKDGRMVWKPKTFKLRYLPADMCDADALCSELVNAGLVVPYGDGYAYIPAFKRHQHINPRESKSTLPDPYASHQDLTRSDASARVNSEIDAQVGREGKGREGIYASDDASDADAPELPSAAPPPPDHGLKPLTVRDLVGDGVEEQHAADWLKARKAKKAPLTQTAWEAVRREADLAGITPAEAVRVAAENSWQGFRASWYAKLPKDTPIAGGASSQFAGCI